jgi:hypothetical protein
MPFVIEWMVRRFGESLLGICSLSGPRLGSVIITHDFLYLIKIVGKEERENPLPLTKENNRIDYTLVAISTPRSSSMIAIPK